MNKCIQITALCSLLLAICAPATAQSLRGEEPQTRTRSPEGMLIEPARRLQGKGFSWTHKIQIALPAAYDQSGKSYPVLWVPDDPGFFEIAIQTAWRAAGRIPEMIIIGIGVPPEELKELRMRRTYEFTVAKNQREH